MMLLFRLATRLVSIVVLALCAQSKPLSAQTDSLNKTPSWYRGEKPWSSIGREGRLEILRMRRSFEANEAKAREHGNGKSITGAAAGKALLSRIVTKYRLDAFYRTPNTFGSRMVIWLPEDEWARLTPSDRDSLKAYMSSQYANWGIGVGRVNGRDVTADRLVVEH